MMDYAAQAQTPNDEAGSDKIGKLMRGFASFISVKQVELDEQRIARRYYAGKQFDDDQLKVLNDRGQPAIVFNVVEGKINQIVGTVRRLRADPKAYPRTEQEDGAADLATNVVRYMVDVSRFDDVVADCARDAAIMGLLVSRLEIEDEDDIVVRHVDASTFFYDPRSMKPDLSDARFMGVYRWIGKGELEELSPGASERAGGGLNRAELSGSPHEIDKDQLWTNENETQFRLVEHWYKSGGKWYVCVYANGTEIAEGESPWVDTRGRSMCGLMAMSAYVDERGNRYGLMRSMKGPQDSINQFRSKAIFAMNARQVIIEEGIVDDVHEARRQFQRPDGMVVLKRPGALADRAIQIESFDQAFVGNTQYYQDAINRLESIVPSPSMIDPGEKGSSGRAIAMLQELSLVELGPFLQNLRTWRLNCYRAMWSNARRMWTQQRAIRVLDDESAQLLPINVPITDEYGQIVQMANAIGDIDVDIIMDEGPDVINSQVQVQEALGILASSGVPIPPQALISTLSIPKRQKDQLLSYFAQMQQPDPMAQQAAALDLAQREAGVMKTQAEAGKITADAQRTQLETGLGAITAAAASAAAMPPQPMPGQPPLV